MPKVAATAPQSPPAPVHFEVPGIPVQQGSMVAPRAGLVLHEKSQLKPWRLAVGLMAREQYKGRPWDGPCSVTLTFYFPMLKRHRRQRGLIAKETKPDLDKLIRAVLDGLTGVLWTDDSRVYDIEARKLFTDASPGLAVEVTFEERQP